MIQCAGCGSNLVYDIARKKMYCKACGNEYEPESVDKDEDSEERKLMELTVFICKYTWLYFLLRAGLFGVLPFFFFQTKRPPAGKEQEKPERMW